MAESILVTGKKISSMELVTNVTGNEKIPTGQPDDLAVTPNQIADHTIQRGSLVSQEVVSQLEETLDSSVTALNQGLDQLSESVRDSLRDEGVARELAIGQEKAARELAIGQEKAARESGDVELQSGLDVLNDKVGVTIPSYVSLSDGVDPVKGVVSGSYFNLRSQDGDSFLEEYQNVDGVAVPTGRYSLGSGAVEPLSSQVEKVSEKLSGEFVSVWDFFTDAERVAYNRALLGGTSATYDSHRPLKEFFDYIAANDVGTAYCSGTFYTSQGILFGGALGSKTKQVMGDFHLCAIAGTSGHTLFLMQCGKELTWLGAIHVQGLGGGIFASRTWRRGLVLGGQYQCAHTYINSANADNGFSEYGVLLDNLTTASNIEAIRVTRCGSGYKLPTQTEENATWTDKSSFTIVSENIAAGVSQSTTLKMTTMPLSGLLFNPILMINGELYHVSNMDYAASQVTIFPLLNRNVTSGTARYIYGAGVATAGGDASVVRIGKLNSTNCGVIYHSGALYPAVMGAQTGQSNTIDVLLGGNSLSQAHVGGVINGLYCEASDFNIVRRTRAQLSFTISTVYAVDPSKFYDLTRVRSAATNTLAEASGMSGIQLAYNGQWLHRENLGFGTNSTLALDVTDINRSEYWHYGTSKTFDIAVPNLAINSQFGYNRKTCILMGTNDSGAPTGSVIFNAPTGYTVNGQPSVTFSGFNQAAKFDVYLQFSRNNFVVVCTTLPPTSAPSASVTYDPPSLAAAGTAGDSATTTVTLTGAALGNTVSVGFSRYSDSIEISAQVSSANTVTVKFKNTSTSPIDLASGTLTVKLV